MNSALKHIGSVTLSNAPREIEGASDHEVDVIRELWAVWAKKLRRNALRSVYYDGKMPIRDFGISTPPQVRNKVRAVLGWPQLAVTALANRTQFDGFAHRDGGSDPLELESILDENRFDVEFSQAVLSAYKHSCSFITVTHGDRFVGEGDVVIQARSAEWSAGIWDRRHRKLSAMLAVTDSDTDGTVIGFDAYLPGVVLRCVVEGRKWVAYRYPQPSGEVMAEPVLHNPDLDRPFGRSVISREIMSITDNALRTIVRTEVSAEFYAAPRMMALGVSEDAFKAGKWEAAIDRWFAITRDEDGELPEVQQFPQMTMQPLLDLYRLYASQMSAASGVPISQLGIVQDNPSSAEAMLHGERALVMNAERANTIHAHTLKRIARLIVLARDGVVTDEVRGLQPVFRNPSFINPVAAADAIVKLRAADLLPAGEVALELAGFSRTDIDRIMAEKRRDEGMKALTDIFNRPVLPVESPKVGSADDEEA